MLITNEISTINFRKTFEKNLSGSDRIQIASGYIGASEIIKYWENLCNVSKKGGTVQIIHGMGGMEGIRKNLYEKLVKLDTELKSTNVDNRVFVHRTHYHGKMYITGNSTTSKVLIGSSNFSKSGFGENLELNFCHSGKEIFYQASELFNRLKKNSFTIDKIVLPDRDKVTAEPKRYQQFDPTIFNTKPDKSIEIRVTKASNLNLFLSKGRINRATNVYTPRPFEEVEITIGGSDLAGIRDYIPDQTEPAEFCAVTDLGTTFMVTFKRKTSNNSDMRTLHHTGIDFMSIGQPEGGRKQLGRYIKGKLIQLGLLRFGDPVTDEILTEYGKRHLDMYFTKSGILYLKF